MAASRVDSGPSNEEDFIDLCNSSTRLLPMDHVEAEKAAAIKNRPLDSDNSSDEDDAVHIEAKPPWWSYIWDYEPGRSKEERRFIQRLDISVLVILSLGYFIKNLDQSQSVTVPT